MSIELLIYLKGVTLTIKWSLLLLSVFLFFYGFARISKAMVLIGVLLFVCYTALPSEEYMNKVIELSKSKNGCL